MTLNNPIPMQVATKCLCGRLLAPIFLLFAAVYPVLCKADAQEQMLQTTGALCAQGLYLTYTSVGTLADGFGKKVYDKDTTSQFLQSYLQIIKNIKEQLNKLQQSGALQGEDVTFMAKVVDTYDLLAAEANALQSYVTSGGQANIDVYDGKRKAAWKNIKEILGISE